MTENDLPLSPGPPASDAGGRSPAAAELKGFMRDFEARMAEFEQRAERLRPLIDATCLNASSEGGEVTVTVTFTGALAGVSLDEASRSLGEEELAALILDTYDRAVAEAAHRQGE